MQIASLKFSVKPTVTPKQAVTYLNELLLFDPYVIHKLLNNRVQANYSLNHHPTVRCDNDIRVGLLGIINGMFGVIDKGPNKGFGPISVIEEISEEPNHLGELRITGFKLTETEETYVEKQVTKLRKTMQKNRAKK